MYNYFNIKSMKSSAEEYFKRGNEKLNNDIDGAINDFTKAIELDSSCALYFHKGG